MSTPRTTVAELGTALGMLGIDLDGNGVEGSQQRPAALVNVTTAQWQNLTATIAAGVHRDVFERSWASGHAFLQARDGLRGRVPIRVEWKGDHRPVGYENLPADLRVDHVYLVSCKDNSRILLNPSPFHLFDGCLERRTGDGGDWYASLDGAAYERFYAAVRAVVSAGDGELPASVAELSPRHRAWLKDALPDRQWPQALRADYAQFCRSVEESTVARWRSNLASTASQEAMYWRLVRLASAPYFLLGFVQGEDVRLRVGSPWDWRQSFEFGALRIRGAGDAGQPTVLWEAEVLRRSNRDVLTVRGRVEVRWSKGRFRRAPEAKVVLDSRHRDVAGYFPID